MFGVWLISINIVRLRFIYVVLTCNLSFLWLHIITLCEYAVIYLSMLLLMMLRFLLEVGLLSHRVGTCLTLVDTNKVGLTFLWPHIPSISLSFYLLLAMILESVIHTSWVHLLTSHPFFSSLVWFWLLQLHYVCSYSGLPGYMLIVKFNTFQ